MVFLAWIAWEVNFWSVADSPKVDSESLTSQITVADLGPTLTTAGPATISSALIAGTQSARKIKIFFMRATSLPFFVFNSKRIYRPVVDCRKDSSVGKSQAAKMGEGRKRFTTRKKFLA